MSKYLLLLLVVVMICSMAGCGGGGDTNGTLSLADITAKDLTGGQYEISSSATFSSATGKSPVGSKIKFTAVYTTDSNPTGITDTPPEFELSPTGIATYTKNVVQGNETVFVTLTASIGGLSQTKKSFVPAIAPLTLAPTAVAFTNLEGIGVTKTIAVTGGFSPYTVSSNKTDIFPSISNGTVTLTKTVNVSAIPSADSAIITVTDNKGNQATASVGYFK